MNSVPQKRILLLDDHTLFAEGLSSKFNEKGFAVDVATRFETCLELLGENQYDLWLCDINLEGKNGLDLVQTVRETHAPDLNIWMLSAYNEPYLIEKAKRLRVDGYCTKTTPFEKLLEAIQNPTDGFVLLSNDAPSEINHTSGETPKAFVLTRQERKLFNWWWMGCPARTLQKDCSSASIPWTPTDAIFSRSWTSNRSQPSSK
jgi:DNA-binding NarL/FixJ family response regulator